MKWMLSTLAVILSIVYGTAACSEPFVPGEVLVKYKTGRYPNTLDGELGKIGWGKVRLATHENMNRVMRTLQENPDITRVEPITFGQFLAEPNDPSFEDQWYLPNIEAPGAWDESLGVGVTIALIDSGVDFNHLDLAGNLLPDGWDFGDDDDDPSDAFGHGTWVCGVIAAIQNNGLGISGCAPDAKILPLKISQGDTDNFTDVAVAEAIIFASDAGVTVINLSLGWIVGEPQVVIDAIEYAQDKGVLLVAAAGNERGPVWFPANQDGVIAVSATDEENEKSFGSAFGPELDLVAPGRFMLTTSLGNKYTYSSGTSFSCALVSGVAALFASQYPHFTRDQIREYLTMRADDLGEEGRDDEFGYGKVNALRTLDPLITFVYPPIIRGSSVLPLVYLFAVFGDDTQFVPLLSHVSFESDYLIPLGPPIVALPRFLLQLVIVGKNPPEGFTAVTVVTGTDEVEGYDVLFTGLFSGNP
jgi:subtilisin family serine protease